MSEPGLGQSSQQAGSPWIKNNPYKAKKQWPPDFTKMTLTEKLRLEKRYKRRLNMKYARPGWMKWTQIFQIVTVTSATVYMVLFMDWKQEKDSHPPYQSIRDFVFGLTSPLTGNADNRFNKDHPADDQVSPTAGNNK